ncbi:4-(cytidine 5'-diphospho)-2-C-methyl-D-erythritol kinase [Chitinophagaceae bacterium LB-8]|uniref:4-diphosphocytidyl-2-C-methyl-D-erythritol kinase n=1 Tax=Paraflavisolibacter caeni TaxID=2982496 RepID=A0A9X2Y0A7_9BACT|nr:4-(cytidine 5'-diphospho)-2-C-methyl-D-erythritol kinase [Paraflavisolibacter caeni]MCU7552192.1 4-(cytidine 5'-diphospho)-2-C-methyl-D-erythritol kinase [Paraflavisolibacter caeni]
MIVFPNCKINLGLNILKKRPDGFHDLQTVFYPIGLQDALEIVQNGQNNETNFHLTGNSIEGKTEDNICLKAYYLLKSDFPDLPPVNFHLHKVIPTGAGLGGGSSDGAFTLLLLNKKFNLGLTEDQLISYALTLGSDCPFFIKNVPSFATSRGEVMKEVILDLSSFFFVIVNPQIHINTGWAFSKIKPGNQPYSLLDVINSPITEWKNYITNDFEWPVFEAFPEVKQIKELLYNKGAVFASMSGSGSTVYGIFEKGTIPSFSFPDHYFLKVI